MFNFFKFNKDISLGDLIVICSIVFSMGCGVTYFQSKLDILQVKIETEDAHLNMVDQRLDELRDRQANDEIDIDRNATIIDQKLNVKP